MLSALSNCGNIDFKLCWSFIRSNSKLAWNVFIITSPQKQYFIGSIFLCKSPRWLVSVGKDKELESVFNKIFEKNAVQRELTEIKEVIEKSKQEGSILKSLSHRHYLIPMLIIFAIAILAQMTGINSILQFSATILKEFRSWLYMLLYLEVLQSL